MMGKNVDTSNLKPKWTNMTQDISTTEPRPYHHGDLHRAIVEAALDVLSESQSTEFSLRELARRAGVSYKARTNTSPTSANCWPPSRRSI